MQNCLNKNVLLINYFQQPWSLKDRCIKPTFLFLWNFGSSFLKTVNIISKLYPLVTPARLFYSFMVNLSPISHSHSSTHSKFPNELLKFCSHISLSPLWIVSALSAYSNLILIFLFFFFLFIVVAFVIHWNETAMGLHVFPIPIPPPTSLSTRSL